MLNKSTIEIISYLKSWGLFKDELEKVKGKEKISRREIWFLKKKSSI